MADRITYVNRSGGSLATSGNTESARTITEPFYEGLVVDVIVDHNHPDYAPKDGYNVGAVKIRIFSVSHGSDSSNLPWAFPFEHAIQQLPLIGELVLCHKVRGEYFWVRHLPLAHRVTENGMLRLNEALSNRATNTIGNAAANDEEIADNKHQFGAYFKPDSRVRQLKHFEGDSIFQGREGHSIRFGSSQIDITSEGMAPNIILRAGQAKDIQSDNATKQSPFGLILEDVNNDVSTIWMTSNQIVPFEPITVEAGSFYRSIVNPPQKFDEGQIIVNSERVILDAKKTHIMLFANEEIYLNSFKRTAIDTSDTIFMTAQLDISHRASRNVDFVVDQNVVINAGKDMITSIIGRISTNGEKTYLGSIDEDKEPQVGGTSLSTFLARLILTLMGTPPAVPAQSSIDPPGLPGSAAPGIATTAHVITPAGPGLLNPVIRQKLQALYAELAPQNPGQEKSPKAFAGAPFNSRDNFILLKNEPAEIVLNNFEAGKQLDRQKNPWILADGYYKVY